MFGLTQTKRNGAKVIRTPQAGDQLVNVMLVIILAAAIGFIGTDVNSEINNSITDDTLDPANNSFDAAQDNLSGGFADAMGLSDIVFIVLMFGVILSVLLAFRMRT